MPVGGDQEQTVDFVLLDEGENQLAFFREAVPRVLAARLDSDGPRHGRGQHFEAAFGIFQRVEQPRPLNGAEHRWFALPVSIVPPVEHDEMHVADVEIEPAAGLLRRSVRRVDPVPGETFKDLGLPRWLEDVWPGHAVVRAEIMVIVNRVGRCRTHQPQPLGSSLPPVITVILSQRLRRVINVNIVAEHQQSVRLLVENRVPHVLPFRHVTGSAPERDAELRGRAGRSDGRERAKLHRHRLPIQQHRVAVRSLRT